MSNDVNRFDNVVLFLHYLWVGPLQAITVTIILLFVLGPSCLMGLAVLILFVPLQSKGCVPYHHKQGQMNDRFLPSRCDGSSVFHTTNEDGQTHR